MLDYSPQKINHVSVFDDVALHAGLFDMIFAIHMDMWRMAIHVDSQNWFRCTLNSWNAATILCSMSQSVMV